MSEYTKMVNLVNDIDDIASGESSDGQGIKIIDENGETSYSYEVFLDMLDKKGLAAFC